MSGARGRRARGTPPADLSTFPRSRVLRRDLLYRAHSVGRSPWWFSSNLLGRFDLIPPNGTCYLATDVLSALRERFGHDLVRQGVVTFKAAAGTQVSTLQVPSTRYLAKTCSLDAANFGMTREIGTCPSYKIPQAWAQAFFNGGKHSGIRYQSRFSTGAASNAVALFDVAGPEGWPARPHPLQGVQACTNRGITVVHANSRRQGHPVQPQA